MRRTLLTEGWETRPHANFFMEMVGAAAQWQPVTLPHDATLARPTGAGALTVTATAPGCDPATVTVEAR